MGIRIDEVAGGREVGSSLERLIRLGLVVYLSPVLLTVLAIGMVGAVASKIAKPGIKPSRVGFASTHKASQPLGLNRKLTQVRERV